MNDEITRSLDLVNRSTFVSHKLRTDAIKVLADIRENLDQGQIDTDVAESLAVSVMVTVARDVQSNAVKAVDAQPIAA